MSDELKRVEVGQQNEQQRLSLIEKICFDNGAGMSDETRRAALQAIGRASDGYKSRSVTPLGLDADATIAQLAQGSMNATKPNG
jgi:hypothetical protein